MAEGTLIDQYEAIAKQLLDAAIAYATANEYSQEADANMRRVRIINGLLQAAVQSAATVTPQVMVPPPPPPD